MQRFGSALLAVWLTFCNLPGAGAAKKTAFYDVDTGDWFYPYVTELVRLGGVAGYEDGGFRPENAISRAEVCAILFRVALNNGTANWTQLAQFKSQAVQLNGAECWANDVIAQANLCGITDFGVSYGNWEQPASRAEIAYMLRRAYSDGRDPNHLLSYQDEARYLIGDYASAVAGNPYREDILWLYNNGIVSGVNAQGDYHPDANCSRAECCTMVVSLLHPERWETDAVRTKLSQPARRLADGADFTGKARMCYEGDVAYDFCRALEEQIGIQIFYLPEWTEKEAGLISYSTIQQFAPSQLYFKDVLTELHAMKAAYDLYPEGFLKEMVQKKGGRTAEIILCPYTFQGLTSFGQHVYDYSDDAKKVDQIYYTGSGDSQYYSHEMGHMVMSCAAIRNGWNTTCSTWERLSSSENSYVSSYAMSNRPEDWAETWAYLWHQTEYVMEACSDPGLLAKVLYMTEILDKQYSSFHAAQVPWASLL